MQYIFINHFYIIIIIINIFHFTKNMMGACGTSSNELKTYGQQHLAEHLSEIENQVIFKGYQEQLEKIDYSLINDLYVNVFKNPVIKEANKFGVISEYIANLQDVKANHAILQQLGLEAIVKGKAAVCLMSGGQGTRLGSSNPKGMFDIGLQSKQTLFEYFSRRLQVLFKLAKSRFNTETNIKAIPWYIMTSDINQSIIKQFFQQHNYWGYDPKSVEFFPQGTIPAVDYQGKIIIQDQGKISLAPGGNGAIYYQLNKHKKLADMRKRGVQYLHIGGIDNILLKLADPLCLGYMIKNNREIVSKFTAKKYPDEKVGLHILNNNKVQVCEYSQLPEAQKNELDSEGKLKYRHSFLANYFISVDFLERITSDKQTMAKLNHKYHIAEKKINLYDRKNKVVIKPSKTTGIKFQLFCFDCFDLTDKFALFEVVRQEEFAPVKNATGVDSPQSARILISNLHKKWFRDLGVVLDKDDNKLFEIDVSLSYNGENLSQIAQKYNNGIQLPLYIH